MAYVLASDNPRKSWLRKVAFTLLGVVVFLIIGVQLEDQFGLRFATTYRFGCAALCLIVIGKFARENASEGWPVVGFWLAAFINVALFFTPIFNRPASRGEIMFFALPDAAVMLAAGLASYRPRDVHERATRQCMIVGLVVAVLFGSALFAAAVMETNTVR